MAALMRHGLLKTSHPYNAAHNILKEYATKPRKPNFDKKITPQIDSSAEFLAAKGFLRTQNSYNPPVDIINRFKVICVSIFGTGTSKFNDPKQKYEFLNKCLEEFNHGVPNSLLYSLKCTDDVLTFYKMPVDANIPLDAMKTMNLPKNLHIECEYHRFHPETDTMFNGVTAFPRSSTLVTGITTKKKYRGHVANQTWPYNT